MLYRVTFKIIFSLLFYAYFGLSVSFAQENNKLFENILNSRNQIIDKNESEDIKAIDKVESLTNSNENEEPSDQQQETSNWNKSLMFNKEKIRWIKSAVKSRESGISLQVLLPDLFPKPKIEKVKIAETDNKINLIDEFAEGQTFTSGFEEVELKKVPNIFLGSVLYFSPSSWAVWINGKKFANKDKSEDFKLLKVYEDKVTLEIDDVEMSNINFEDKENYRTNNQNLYITSDRKVTVDKLDKSILVSLNTYQSFIGSNLEVVEGDKTSQSLDIKETIGDILSPLENILN